MTSVSLLFFKAASLYICIISFYHWKKKVKQHLENTYKCTDNMSTPSKVLILVLNSLLRPCTTLQSQSILEWILNEDCTEWHRNWVAAWGLWRSVGEANIEGGHAVLRPVDFVKGPPATRPHLCTGLEYQTRQGKKPLTEAWLCSLSYSLTQLKWTQENVKCVLQHLLWVLLWLPYFGWMPWPCHQGLQASSCQLSSWKGI